MDLVLVRHGEPEEGARGRCYGTLDVGLSEAGRGQCRTLAEALRGERVSHVVSSPRRRALETARAIAAPHGLDVVPLDGLRELDFGALEGRSYDEIALEMPELYARWMQSPTTVRFPGGEGYADLSARVSDAVSDLRRTHDREVVVAVTHGGVVRAVLAEVLELPAERIFRLGVDPASITRIAWTRDVPVVRCVNVVPRPPAEPVALT